MPPHLLRPTSSLLLLQEQRFWIFLVRLCLGSLLNTGSVLSSLLPTRYYLIPELAAQMPSISCQKCAANLRAGEGRSPTEFLRAHVVLFTFCPFRITREIKQGIYHFSQGVLAEEEGKTLPLSLPLSVCPSLPPSVCLPSGVPHPHTPQVKGLVFRVSSGFEVPCPLCSCASGL